MKVVMLVQDCDFCKVGAFAPRISFARARWSSTPASRFLINRGMLSMAAPIVCGDAGSSSATEDGEGADASAGADHAVTTADASRRPRSGFS